MLLHTYIPSLSHRFYLRSQCYLNLTNRLSRASPRFSPYNGGKRKGYLMYKVTFKDFNRSSFAEDVVSRRLNQVFQKFPDLKNHKITFSMAMMNSQFHSGPDLFSAKLQIAGKKFKNIIIEKKSPNLYKAISQVFSVILEVLVKHGQKVRTRKKALARKYIQKQRMLLGYS